MTSPISCSNCHEVLDNEDSHERHEAVCKGRKPDRRRKGPANKRKCGHCRATCEAPDELMRHLKSCEDANTGLIRPREADPPIDECLVATEGGERIDLNAIFDDSDTKFKVREAPHELVKELDDNPISNDTNPKPKCGALPDGENVDMCGDSGASRSMIAEHFLEKLEQHGTVERCSSFEGINGDAEMTHWAKFSFYIPGVSEKGNSTMVKFTKSAFTSKELDVNMLLANDFIERHGGVMNYDTRITTFTKVGLRTPFKVLRRATPCVRKVTAKQKVTLTLG